MSIFDGVKFKEIPVGPTGRAAKRAPMANIRRNGAIRLNSAASTILNEIMPGATTCRFKTSDCGGYIAFVPSNVNHDGSQSKKKMGGIAMHSSYVSRLINSEHTLRFELEEYDGMLILDVNNPYRDEE